MLLGNPKKRFAGTGETAVLSWEQFSNPFPLLPRRKNGEKWKSNDGFLGVKICFQVFGFRHCQFCKSEIRILNPLNPDFLFERALGRNWVSKDWIASCPISRIRGPFLPGLACAQTPATQLGYSRSCTKRCKKGFCSSDLALELVVSRLCVNLPFFNKEIFV